MRVVVEKSGPTGTLMEFSENTSSVCSGVTTPKLVESLSKYRHALIQAGHQRYELPPQLTPEIEQHLTALKTTNRRTKPNCGSQEITCVLTLSKRLLKWPVISGGRCVGRFSTEDHGSVYTSSAFQETCRYLGVKQSMGGCRQQR